MSKPWGSLKHRLYNQKLERTFRPILGTRLLKCNPQAKVEIHTLTCHYHLPMYISAIKSLLRFYDDIAVIVHDDGTLNGKDNILLEKHVKGIRVIDKASADKKVGDALGGYKTCAKYRPSVINSMELLDFMLLAEKNKIICMNSDVLFLSKPEELINWALNCGNEIIGVYEDKPAYQRQFLSELGCDFPPNITLGLLCCYRDIFDPGLVESILARIEAEHIDRRFDKFIYWYYGQNIYPILIKNRSDIHKTSFFAKDKYQASGVFKDGAIFRHYWTSTGWFLNMQRNDSRMIIRDIGI